MVIIVISHFFQNVSLLLYSISNCLSFVFRGAPYELIIVRIILSDLMSKSVLQLDTHRNFNTVADPLSLYVSFCCVLPYLFCLFFSFFLPFSVDFFFSLPPGLFLVADFYIDSVNVNSIF